MRKRLMSLTFFVLLLSAFAQAGEVEYAVPTEDPALLPFSKFKVQIHCQRDNGKLSIQYVYPVELTGTPAVIHLQQSSRNPGLFFGPNGRMNCADGTCSIKYRNLPFDEVALDTHLKSISKDIGEFDSRMALALINRPDPGGSFDQTPAQYCFEK